MNFTTRKICLDNIGVFKSFVTFLFIVTFFVFAFTTEADSDTLLSYLKYGVLVVAIVVSAIFIVTHRNELLPKKITSLYFYLFFVLFIFLIASFFRTLYAGKLTTRIIMEFFFLIAPIIYSYLTVLIYPIKQIYYLLIVVFLISFFAYLFGLNMSASEIIKNLLQSNFLTSTSKLESHFFAGMSVSLSLFFLYYNKNILITILSVLFVFFTFKRLSLVFVIFFFLCTLARKYLDKKPNKIFEYSLIFLSIIALLFYYVLMQPSVVSFLSSSFGIDLQKITMTRTDRLQMLLNSNYYSYGFGSSTEYMYANFGNVSLEMDMIKIIIEIGFIPAISFVYGYYKFGSRNYYSLLIVGFCILNLITASSLTSVFSWIIFYITITEINYNKKSRLYYEI